MSEGRRGGDFEDIPSPYGQFRSKDHTEGTIKKRNRYIRVQDIKSVEKEWFVLKIRKKKGEKRQYGRRYPPIYAAKSIHAIYKSTKARDERLEHGFFGDQIRPKKVLPIRCDIRKHKEMHCIENVRATNQRGRCANVMRSNKKIQSSANDFIRSGDTIRK